MDIFGFGWWTAPENKEGIMDNLLKEKILKTADKSGIDIDGDILTIGDKNYYVHILNKVVEEMEPR